MRIEGVLGRKKYRKKGFDGMGYGYVPLFVAEAFGTIGMSCCSFQRIVWILRHA